MVISAVTINTVVPRGGPAGTSVTVTGSGFGAPTGQVLFDPLGVNLAGIVTAWSDISVTFTVPTGVPKNRTLIVQILRQDGSDFAQTPFWIPAATPPDANDGQDYQWPDFELGTPDQDTDNPRKIQAADFNRIFDRIKALGTPTPGPDGPPGLVWKGPWTNVALYQVHDAVERNGSAYVAIAINSNSPPPSANWELLASKGDPGTPGTPGTGLIWRANWNALTAYVVGDAVEYLGSSYVAIAPSTGSTPPSAAWSLFAQKGDPGAPGAPGTPGASFTYRSSWNALTTYAVNDVVTRLGNVYMAIAPSTGSAPPSAPWDLMVPASAGVNWRGAWSAVLGYAINDVVIYLGDGNTYIAVAPSTGVVPPSTGIWELFTRKGDQGNQGAVGPSGGATGAQGLQGNQGNAGVTGVTSSAGYRQQQVTAASISGQQTLPQVNTAQTPIATDRVYVVVNGQVCRQGLFVSVAIVAGVSFTVTWLGAYDLAPTDDVLIVWFTTPP